MDARVVILPFVEGESFSCFSPLTFLAPAILQVQPKDLSVGKEVHAINGRTYRQLMKICRYIIHAKKGTGTVAISSPGEVPTYYLQHFSGST